VLTCSCGALPRWFGGCLEVRLSELFCAVLCIEVVHSHKHTYHEQFLQFSGLGFVSLGPYTVPRFFCVYACVCVCVILSYSIMCCISIIVTRWGGPGGIEG